MLDLKKQLRQGIKEGIKKAIPYVLEKIKEKTPEDTTDLIKGYETKIGPKSGEITNGVDYAPYVEYGVGRPYNYYKHRPNFIYHGVGARMMTRTRDEEEQNIADLIEKEIDAAMNGT